MSRPKVQSDIRKSRVVTVKISEPEYDLLTNRARNSNMTVSEFIRRSFSGARIRDRSVENMYHEIRSITNLLSRLLTALKRAYVNDEADKKKLLAVLEPAQAASEKAKDTLTLLQQELTSLREQDKEIDNLFS